MKRTVGTWVESPEIECAGRAFFGDQLLNGTKLATYLLEAHRKNKLAGALHDLNGSFAFVIGRPGKPEVVGVDRLRSIPLFYAEGGEGSTLVARKAAELRAGGFQPTSGEEATFLRCGYVLGSRTLHPEISQVIAGSIVRFASDAEPTVERYHRHTRCHGWPSANAGSYDTLDRTSSAVGERLTTVLDGRQALVPLSGGYDSRYVVSMLAEQGYHDVQLFTYGTPSGFEAKIAAQVAEAFDYPWEFVAYSRTGLARFVESESFSRYWTSAGNLCALPHVQEPYALDEMQKRGLVRDDAVVVPGFCGDVLGGSFLAAEVIMGKVGELLAAGLAEHVIGRFLYLDNTLPDVGWMGLRDHVGASIDELPTPTDLDEFVAEANAWAVENRLARYVINALRAYEAAGLDWYMPLWDSELTDFWYSVPVGDLVAKRLYNGYLLDRRFPRYGADIRQAPQYWSTAWFKRLRRLVPQSLVNPLWRLRDTVSGTRRFDVNAFGPIAEWGVDPLGEHAPTYDGNVSRVLVHRYLHDVATGFESHRARPSPPSR